jgi:hypothetical protein
VSRAVRRILIPTCACAIVSACGGSTLSKQTSSGGTTSAATPTQATTQPGGLSHSALIARMNALCTAATTKVVALNAGKGTTVQKLRAALAVDREYDRKFERLRASATDRSALEHYVHAINVQRSLTARAIRPYESGDKAVIERLQSVLEGASKERIAAATNLGTQMCGGKG